MDIEFSKVDFAYGSDPIIKNFSMKAKEGDVIGIKGDSGSGKTTLFRLLLGFEIPDSGEITFNGKQLNPKELKVFRRETTWLPQDLNLGEGKVKEVFYYPFTFQANKIRKPDEDKVLTTFDTLGLQENTWSSNFSDLSTGQRQRVGIALCYLLDKSILILDEPTSSLDETSKEQVVKLLFDNKRIIISTSHDPWWIDRCSQTIDLNS